MIIWNPWHGCRRISPGCAHCYVYRRDESIGKDASVVAKTGDYDLPLKRNRRGEWKVTADGGTVFTCMTSDFFLEEADDWRQDCWDMMRWRHDLSFHIITKRIGRFEKCLPPDWGDGWDNVTIVSTCEDQDRADERLPVLLALPIRHKQVICEPLLGAVNIEQYLASGQIEHVTCGGESGAQARLCDNRWVQEIRRECIRYGVSFTFKQTGALFLKDGRYYHIDRKDQMPQAQKSGYSYRPGTHAADRIVYQWPKREELFDRLSRSAFRSRFRLAEKDKEMIRQKGWDVLRRHAEAFVSERLSAENPVHDGQQTPMKGHPVFVAQHATACCCRSCIEKWHRIPAGKILTDKEQAYLVEVLMEWIERQMADTLNEAP